MAERVQGISGAAIAAIFAGGIFAWSGLSGWKISLLTQDILSGKDPKKDPRLDQTKLGVNVGGLFSGVLPGNPLGAFGGLGGLGTGIGTGIGLVSTGGSVSGSNAQNKALGQRMAAAVGWSGSQWIAFNNIIMSESGWNATIKNPTSTASGIGQNIQGFGPGYQYGNAAQQIAWTIHYIQQRYGTPANAWQFHLAHGWY